MAISDYLTSLINDRDNLVTNLTAMGITGLTGDETFTELVPEVLNAQSVQINPISKTSHCKPSTQNINRGANKVFVNKTWTGLTNFHGSNVWTDGTNIYYSSSSNQYVLDKTTSAWSTKTWTGLTSFDGSNIWTDGNNIYCSTGSNQYVLNKSTSTWSTKTWNGLTDFDGSNIWTDGTDIYYSSTSNQYVLNKATSTWSIKTWTGLTDFNASSIWTDGIDIYHSAGNQQYVLDKATSTWTTKSWGISIAGQQIWTDGTTIYKGATALIGSQGASGGPSGLNATDVWTDGANIYFSNGNTQKVLTIVSTNPQQLDGFAPSCLT